MVGMAPFDRALVSSYYRPPIVTCVGLIVRAICSEISNLCDPDSGDPPMSRTNRRTDDMQSQDLVLHYSASRGKNYGTIFFRRVHHNFAISSRNTKKYLQVEKHTVNH